MDTESESESDFSLSETWEINPGEIAVEYSELVKNTIVRIAAYCLREDVWKRLPAQIEAMYTTELTPFTRSTTEYEFIKQFKDAAKEMPDAPIHTRKSICAFLRPIDLVVLLPLIIRNRADMTLFTNKNPNVAPILTGDKLRALYIYVTTPASVLVELVSMPDFYRHAHDAVIDALDNKTAMAKLQVTSMPEFIDPNKVNKPIRWTRKNASKLLPVAQPLCSAFPKAAKPPL